MMNLRFFLMVVLVFTACGGSKEAQSEAANPSAPSATTANACESRFLIAESPNPDGTPHRYYEFCCPSGATVNMRYLWDSNTIPEAVDCKRLSSDDSPPCRTPGMKRYLCEPVANCSTGLRSKRNP